MEVMKTKTPNTPTERNKLISSHQPSKPHQPQLEKTAINTAPAIIGKTANPPLLLTSLRSLSSSRLVTACNPIIPTIATAATIPTAAILPAPPPPPPSRTLKSPSPPYLSLDPLENEKGEVR